MNTEEIADSLELTAKLMELHEENPFKVRAVANGAYNLSKTRIDLTGKTQSEIEQIEGIGKSIAAKITELLEKGTTTELEELKSKTPLGVIEIMGVKGLGPKKVRQLWHELQIESIGELLYACNENRLIDLKGFGTKTQESVKQNIEFAISNSGKLHYARAEKEATVVLNQLKKIKGLFEEISFTGELRRRNDIITKIELLCSSHDLEKAKTFLTAEGYLEDEDIENTFVSGNEGCPIFIYLCEPGNFYKELFQTTGSGDFIEDYLEVEIEDPESEEAIFESLGLQYIEPELRESKEIIDRAKANKIPTLIEFTDLKGSLHNHSTYSDGMNSLEEMAVHCKSLGYEYLGICDHSQSAFYADGLKPETVLVQQKEIEKLNTQLAPFKIFKGIESDILNDGSLDYTEEILKTFDFVVASIHSNLKMTTEKANERLIKAIENPYTTILGHPTGRLLLARQGYPIDHKKIIDACAANGVIIELNAHPYRLDIDWRWIPYCLKKGVKISINPDAHQKDGYNDMRYGVYSARKGMLDKGNCFNALNLAEIETYFITRKKERN
ncbi:MAG TPA: PHP domain-containing protein [Bacteroidia bacterium]|jgi:DNA polymerase (family 10)|nr:PHP domain-containing protein [Bacteroidia bacterium]